MHLTFVRAVLKYNLLLLPVTNLVIVVTTGPKSLCVCVWGGGGGWRSDDQDRLVFHSVM